MKLDQSEANLLKRKNFRTIKIIFLVVCCMIGLAYASVPLYSLFCKVTGFGGTTQISKELPKNILNRVVTIRFDANTSPNLPWDFKPEILQSSIRLGERGLTNFIAVNNAQEDIAGTALYNVTPLKAGKYFTKIQCFCFGEQILKPGQKVNMPVVFYVDPSMNDDPLMDDVETITLSYTFFKIGTPDLDKAQEEFYNSGSSP